MLKKAILAACLTLSCAAAAQANTLVKIDGSSTVYPLTEAVAEEFQKGKKGAVRVTVGISGTGGGFKKFCRGEIDISDASRPILKKEMEACAAAGIKYIELPVAYDALTVVVNPQNSFIKTMTVEELKKIWEPTAQGKITKWNQVNPSWPDLPIKLFGAGADSGTFDYFTEAIVGKSKSSRGDFTASEDDNVLVQGVSRDKGALGFFGYSYYAENTKKLKAVAIAEKAGKSGVLPSFDTVKNGTYQPLSRPVFIYVSAKSLEKPEVREFVDFYLANAAKYAKAVKMVGLPDKAYKQTQSNFKAKKTGTGFGGVPEVGVSVEELLQREGKH
ncbi:PstS family phosphate ABC transporter substrate-binding protein [Trichlorobacter ammonificans]|uniref:Phosphate-binding protein n=1 Tax=Trichlorobacter ammonificans TaxID=2916410 RepID=A0ABM9DB78_9BACT|nr:PstS family phosphate ABC transporter substrate-binding protein [Trichlorobacter ammonificans]CAH2032493.1 Protein SphX [Trichlorobacter ammonificans]